MVFKLLLLLFSAKFKQHSSMLHSVGLQSSLPYVQGPKTIRTDMILGLNITPSSPIFYISHPPNIPLILIQHTSLYIELLFNILFNML